MNNITKQELPTVPVPQPNDLKESFTAALQVVDDIVLKNYIAHLQKFEVVPLDRTIVECNLAENVRFFKISEMVYEKDEYSTYKFASVFNALSTTNCAVFILIDSDGEKTDFYMGIRSLDSDRTTNSLKDTLKNAMAGQFPGIKTKDFLDEDMRGIINRIKANSISAVSCVANSKDEDNRTNKSFIQGLEKLALSMQGEKYTAVILANGTPQSQLAEIRKGYETIYTQLSPFANTQVSYATNKVISLSEALTTGSSHGVSLTKNSSTTNGTTTTTGTGVSHSISTENIGSKAAKGVAAAAGLLGAVLAPMTGGVSLVAGGVIAGGLGLVGSAMQETETHGETSNNSTSNNFSETSGKSHSVTNTTNENNTHTKGLQSGISQNVMMTLQDKTIINILERLDIQLKRLQEFESLGMWECAAYFMSDNPYAAEIAASTYKALMRGENSGVEVSAINSWGKFDGSATAHIREYVTNFIHPVFLYNSPAVNISVTPCSLVSGNELALHMGLPRRSVCGFPVIEHADFGKEVVSYNGLKATHTINLGKVFNMGSECGNRVELNRNSLSMHTFVTGSTGSGKSNTVYELLRQLDAVDIRFMVIEPAKGEYKTVFGNRHDVHVFGTNPQYSHLLQINPFKFPSEIHILEHIDRLIEIFNVCWPMYAAMPAVLKDAVLQAYEVCGWDLVESENRFSANLFPTFGDLQTELVNVIENSAYSQELKSNYIGSLATRVKSLTNGLNGQIFSAKETDNNLLFDQNVIVDLSRVGSLETKALIMGILVMRLNEHRMSYTKGMNVPLKHVTVLEEAHNILKRTSSEQNPESPSVAGKSVEMLSNAIAEMRTYGEGFIIADQSPSAVDISAIRNTNTKIIMRLPDETDRRLAGKSAALKDEQLDEIAKLPRGVAAIYQNDWLEPVLCKIRKFDRTEAPYQYSFAEQEKKIDENKFKLELVKLLLLGRTVERVEPDIEFLKNTLDGVNLSTKNKIGVYHLINEYGETGLLKVWEDDRFSDLAALITELTSGKKTIESIVSAEAAFVYLNRSLSALIDKYVPNLSEELKLSVCQCLMKDFSRNDAGRLEIYSAWRKDITERGNFR